MSISNPIKAALHIESVNGYGDGGLRISIDSGSLILDVPTVDSLLEELARLRADMKPAVEHVVDRQKRFLIEMDPNWHVETNALYDGAIFLMRHSGLGWACFGIPRSSLAQLVERLSEQLRQPEEQSGFAN